VLGVLGGAFIGLGAVFATTVGAGGAALPYGVVKLLTGLVFSVGLLLVILAGAELFTGNNLIVMAWANRRVRTSDVLLNWLLAFVGNFLGAIVTAGLVFYSTQYTFGGGAVGLNALVTANGKAALAFMPAVLLGVMCNALVCLAVWMCFGARTNIDRVVSAVPPIACFVAAGFEHCIANIYFIPMGLFIKAAAPEAFWQSIGRSPADFPALTWENFLIGNLLPVTIGNVIGGSLMVGAVYWFVYLRRTGQKP
jgi:formate transporter